MKKLTWYHKLGFFNNPLSIKPAAFHNELMGYDQTIEEVNNKIKESGIMQIYGEYGTGKTTVLKKIIDEFKGRKRVIYYNCNQSEKSIDFDKLLINAGGFFRKLFRIRKKNMIILLDESQDMNKKDLKQVKAYYDEGFFKSVIFVSKGDIRLTGELENIIGKNKYGLAGLNKKEAVKMVRKRIGKLKILSDESIIKIFNKNNNPRFFLKNCEDACRHAFESGTKEVKDEHIKALDKN